MIIHYKISAYLHNQLRELDEGPLVVVGHHHSEACVGGVSQVGVKVVHVSFSFFVLLSFENVTIASNLFPQSYVFALE